MSSPVSPHAPGHLEQTYGTGSSRPPGLPGEPADTDYGGVSYV